MRPRGRRPTVGIAMRGEHPQDEPGGSAPPSFERATVGEFMRRGVMSCPPDASLGAVARTMATHRVHAVVVQGGGVLSDRDLAHALALHAVDATARDVARTEAATIAPGASLAEAALLMDRHRISHLLVVDAGRPVGMLSTLDLARAVAWGRP